MKMQQRNFSKAATIVGLGFVAMGLQHFLKPKLFEKIVPQWVEEAGLSAKDANIVSGAAEIAGGLGLLLPATRPAARLGLLALLVAVFPANVEMAINPQKYKRFSPLLLWARLPLQPLMAWMVWKVGR